MELDGLRLDAGENPVDVVDMEIGFGTAVLLFDRRLPDRGAEEAFTGRGMVAVALEEAALSRASVEVERPPLEEGKHERPGDPVIG
jgi:hypothetical protein